MLGDEGEGRYAADRIVLALSPFYLLLLKLSMEEDAWGMVGKNGARRKGRGREEAERNKVTGKEKVRAGPSHRWM